MHIHSQAYQYPHTTPINHYSKTLAGSLHTPDDRHPVDRARHRFRQRAEEEGLNGSLSEQAQALVKAALSPNNAAMPGVQLATFAVDGVQANDVLLIKRVPIAENAPNFVLYVPSTEGPSFHTFNSREELTAWVKEQAADPDTLSDFAAHFFNDAAPGRDTRVQDQLKRFAEDDINVVVGGYGYEKGDMFKRLDKDVTQPPVPVNGLTQTRFYAFDRRGDVTYKGYLQDGKEMLYKYDAYGNLHGASGTDTFNFVQNGLNSTEPLVPITRKQYLHHVTAVAMDNVGANDYSGMFHEFIRQLRNPGDGLATALIVFGLPPDVAHSIEDVVKNPGSGSLLQLNQDNRMGKIFGADKDTMDGYLEKVGDDLQSAIPRYGKVREGLNVLAGFLEKHGPPTPDTRTKVNAR